MQSDERQLLWQALRERAETTYGAQELHDIDLPEEVLAILLGIKESEAHYADDV